MNLMKLTILSPFVFSSIVFRFAFLHLTRDISFSLSPSTDDYTLRGLRKCSGHFRTILLESVIKFWMEFHDWVPAATQINTRQLFEPLFRLNWSATSIDYRWIVKRVSQNQLNSNQNVKHRRFLCASCRLYCGMSVSKGYAALAVNCCNVALAWTFWSNQIIEVLRNLSTAISKIYFEDSVRFCLHCFNKLSCLITNKVREALSYQS